MTDIYGLTYEALGAALADIGEKSSRAGIIYPAVYGELAESFDSLPLKEETIIRLRGNFSFGAPELLDVRTSETADKYLWKLNDGCTIESVLMKHEFGYNVCVSTQVGCNMGCKFCLSGRLRRRRDLTVSEMTGQVVGIAKHSGCKIGGISVMGIGEPMDNLANVLDFIAIMTHPKGLAIGIKHITLSTCGIAPKIYELAKSAYPVNLAISLHAPTDALRATIMPIAKKYALAEVMKAARYYSEKLNRRVTLEYVMLDGVNDSGECAEKLAELIGSMNAYVNIIRYNPSPESAFKCSPHERIMGFYDVLKKRGIGVTMRRSLGDGISAACGQLSAGRDGSRR
ncbi:MAG: 23S rRNA (adenine(2503)-C(2))-methyltransferase RlmN [Ruminiclostridium sp.]|nr:23S rRNA (adenine(2503)-C(2))-methyltransferase RlmN [Ruminiclostridium sp.]